MLFIESLETMRCFDEGVLRSTPEANIGSIMGIGFPPWTGGVVQYIAQYAGGPAGLRGARPGTRRDATATGSPRPRRWSRPSKEGKVRLAVSSTQTVAPSDPMGPPAVIACDERRLT